MKLKQNEHAGDFYNNSDFNESLRACRYFGILAESDYGIINKIRDARNDYAHNFENYREKSIDIEREGKIDDAVKLYEELIGVKNSMTEKEVE